MGFQYSCDNTPQSNVWLYEYKLDTTNVLTGEFYAVRCYNTTSNVYYGMIFVDGQQMQTVNSEYKRILWYNTDQTVPYTTNGSYMTNYDVTYFNGDAMVGVPSGFFQDYQTGTTQELNSATFINQMSQNARNYFDTPTSGTGTATVEIDIEGEQLTFESQMLGNTITRFIDDDAEVNMEE